MPEGFTVKEKLCTAKAAGFDFMEISIDETEAKLSRLYDPSFISQLKRDIAESEFPVLTMCLSGHRKYPLGTENSQNGQKALEIMAKAIEFALNVGIRIIQIAGYDEYYGESNENTRILFLERLQECVRMASEKGVVLGFETMETPFMNTVAKSMRYVNLINSPYLQIYPDIGNVTNGAADALQDLRSGKGHIVAAHLKETQQGVYRNLFFGEGRVDFQGCIAELKAQGVRFYNCEFWYDGVSIPLEYLRRARNFFRDLGL